MERSPTRWKTLYRDQFRKFSGSPQRGEAGADLDDGDDRQFEVNPAYAEDAQYGSHPLSSAGGHHGIDSAGAENEDLQNVKGRSGSIVEPQHIGGNRGV